MIVWNNDYFYYNKKCIEDEVTKIKGISNEFRLAIYQYIKKTNYLFFLSYKELHLEK